MHSCFYSQANLCTDPLEVYSFLNDQNIGCQVADMYEGWAYELEQLGDMRKANSIIEEGLRRGAQPTEKLLQIKR